MRSLQAALILGAFILLGACGGSGDTPGHSTDRQGVTTNKLYSVSYAPNPNPIPFSALFDLNVLVKDAKGNAVDGATVSINVTMPAHGHGMQTKPEISPQGSGKYDISGMMFHMHGVWQIVLTVDGAAGSDSITFMEDFE